MSTPTSNIKIFIAGAPRSGTSILLFALKQVFELPGYGESHVMPAFNQMVHSFYRYWEPFKSVDQGVLEETMLRRVSLEDVQQHVFRYVRNLYTESFPAGSWVDKTPSPSGVTSLPMAEQVFPDAKLIATKRNGIEVVSSHVKKFNDSFESACDVWLDTMAAISKIRPLCKQLLIVDQFDFSNAPDRVASEITSHVGLPDKANALMTFLTNERVELSSSHDWSKRLRLEEMNWSRDQKEYFRVRCGSTMSEWGYDL